MSNRRLLVFLLALLMAAAPLFWFEIDANAGDKLLRWTSKSSNYSLSR